MCRYVITMLQNNLVKHVLVCITVLLSRAKCYDNNLVEYIEESITVVIHDMIFVQINALACSSQYY